jgi:hypothetical protein
MTKKIRPNRILKGFLAKKTEFSEERLKTCKECPLLKLNAVCGMCGCVVSEKTKVIEEHCPDNRWEDTRVREDLGLAVINLSPEKADLHINREGHFEIIYKNLVVGEDSEVNLMLVNERSKFFDEDINLSSLEVKSSCQCTLPSKIKETLLDGEYETFSVSYNNKKPSAINQSLFFKAKTNTKQTEQELFFRIFIKGTVNAKL